MTQMREPGSGTVQSDPTVSLVVIPFQAMPGDADGKSCFSGLIQVISERMTMACQSVL